MLKCMPAGRWRQQERANDDEDKDKSKLTKSTRREAEIIVEKDWFVNVKKRCEEMKRGMYRHHSRSEWLPPNRVREVEGKRR